MVGEYFCKEHQTVWFKKGNMRGYAHPIEGGGWCNMPKEGPKTEAKLPLAAPESKSTLVAEEVKVIPQNKEREQDIHRQVAFKGAVELCASGKIPLDAVGFRTEYYTRLLNGTIKFPEEAIDAIEKMTIKYAMEAVQSIAKKAEAK